MEQVAHSLFIKQLKTYYQHLFPYDSMVDWLSLSAKEENPTNLSRREFSFNIDLDQDEQIYCRYLSFGSADELKTSMVKKVPVKIDIGAVYNMKPQKKSNVISTGPQLMAQQKELVLDIDMDAYDPVRTCCQGSQICDKCWHFLQAAAEIL